MSAIPKLTGMRDAEPDTSSLSNTHGGHADRLLVTPRHAAQMLSISERTLWGMADIPRVRIGRAVRYDIDDIRAWIARRKGVRDAT